MTGPGTPAAGLDPCAEERRIADERCALADRLGEAAQAAADRLSEAQRVYDEHVGRSERAAAVADPRAVRVAKEAAWAGFRRSNAEALSREAVEAAARDWLQEIDRVGRTAQEAELEVAREHEAAAAMVGDLERLGLEAEAAKINAESASAACAAARVALDACEVAERDRIAGKAHAAAEEAEGIARPRLLAGVDPEPAGRTLVEEVPERLIGDHEPAILKLLRGDRDALDRLVTALAGAVPADRRRWQTGDQRPGGRDPRPRDRGIGPRVPGRQPVLGDVQREPGPRYRDRARLVQLPLRRARRVRRRSRPEPARPVAGGRLRRV